MFFQANIVRQPMLSAIRALVDSVPHGPRINGRWQPWIDRDGRHAPGTKTREFFPELTSVTRFVDGIVCRDIEDFGIGRVQSNRHDGLTVLLATHGEG